MKLLERLFHHEKKPNVPLEEEEAKLHEIERHNREDEALRRRVNAHLKMLQAELDNLTRSKPRGRRIQ